MVRWQTIIHTIRKLLISAREITICTLTILFDTFVLLFTKRDTGKKNHVLIVRADQIGDFVLWLPAAKDLRALFPRDRFYVTLIANSVWSDLAIDQGDFDEVWSIDMRQLKSNRLYRLQKLRQVRSAGFSVAIQPTYSREVLCGDSLVRASGAAERIGLVGDCTITSRWLMRIADLWYTRLLLTSTQPVMELARNAEFVRALGGVSSIRAPTIRINRDDLPAELSGVSYFVLFPGAQWPEKRWPIERFVEITARVLNRYGWTGVVCGGRDDAVIGRMICDAAGVPLIDLTASTTLQELAVILANARLVLTNDTSAAHIAVAVEAPTVCIVGGGHFGRFLPYAIPGTSGGPCVVNHHMDCYQCSWRCIYRVKRGLPYPCIDGVTTDAVWEAILKIVDGAKSGEAHVETMDMEMLNRRE